MRGMRKRIKRLYRRAFPQREEDLADLDDLTPEELGQAPAPADGSPRRSVIHEANRADIEKRLGVETNPQAKLEALFELVGAVERHLRTYGLRDADMAGITVLARSRCGAQVRIGSVERADGNGVVWRYKGGPGSKSDGSIPFFLAIQDQNGIHATVDHERLAGSTPERSFRFGILMPRGG